MTDSLSDRTNIADMHWARTEKTFFTVWVCRCRKQRKTVVQELQRLLKSLSKLKLVCGKAQVMSANVLNHFV